MKIIETTAVPPPVVPPRTFQLTVNEQELGLLLSLIGQTSPHEAGLDTHTLWTDMAMALGVTRDPIKFNIITRKL